LEACHNHSIEYDEYMHSEAWAERKRRLFEKRGYSCEMCYNGRPLEVHHKNYDRLGRELDDDLLIVCVDCHKKADRMRVEWEARRKYQREHPIRWRTLEEIETFTMKLISKEILR
jgi:hypothetical protein